MPKEKPDIHFQGGTKHKNFRWKSEEGETHTGLSGRYGQQQEVRIKAQSRLMHHILKPVRSMGLD